ncbi:MAG: ATP-binding protein [Aquincola sp.]|nr:ATP-binding protein [Aquincola sp.]MDH4289442.1 ATP-binding protein [Aquincola sp.]MDH5330457.1 ATP-binding protein [Aquincola sp.]
MSGAIVIAIVGAESTGKSTLAVELARRLALDTGLACTHVDEYLRTWCERARRTPRADEQRGIAQIQHERIAAAAERHDVVVADTTALMVAVYSRLVYGDRSLDAWAGAAHLALAAHTLVTALDLPWVPDGLQRDGPHVRGPVDSIVRELLAEHRIGWSLVGGLADARVESALDAVSPLLRERAAPGTGLFTRLAARDAEQPAWQWVCDKCDMPDCEHQLLARGTR